MDSKLIWFHAYRWQKFKDRFNIPTILEFYGATEAPGASMVYSNNDFYRGAIGRGGLLMRTLFGGNQALIKHEHETGEAWRDPKTGFCVKVATDEPGELVYTLDPENINEKFQGYLGNDKASNSKIITDVFKKGDAYYRSGDLQRRDGDGRWWFMDRIGDTFRWKVCVPLFHETAGTNDTDNFLRVKTSAQPKSQKHLALTEHYSKPTSTVFPFPTTTEEQDAQPLA